MHRHRDALAAPPLGVPARPPGAGVGDTSGKLVTALKQLGFDLVYGKRWQAELVVAVPLPGRGTGAAVAGASQRRRARACPAPPSVPQTPPPGPTLSLWRRRTS